MISSRIFSRNLAISARLYNSDIKTHKLAQDPPTEVELDKTPDDLLRYLWIKCQSHEQAMLDSYGQFVESAAKHLSISHVRTEEPWRIIKRRTLLGSRFVHKKCRVQYEHRTYFRNILFKNLTGSTADTFLEYVERNLPEGMLLIVEKHTLAELPFDLEAKK